MNLDGSLQLRAANSLPDLFRYEYNFAREHSVKSVNRACAGSAKFESDWHVDCVTIKDSAISHLCFS
jgi:hypothetical protein